MIPGIVSAFYTAVDTRMASVYTTFLRAGGFTSGLSPYSALSINYGYMHSHTRLLKFLTFSCSGGLWCLRIHSLVHITCGASVYTNGWLRQCRPHTLPHSVSRPSQHTQMSHEHSGDTTLRRDSLCRVSSVAQVSSTTLFCERRMRCGFVRCSSYSHTTSWGCHIMAPF